MTNTSVGYYGTSNVGNGISISDAEFSPSQLASEGQAGLLGRTRATARVAAPAAGAGAGHRGHAAGGSGIAAAARNSRLLFISPPAGASPLASLLSPRHLRML